jgi:sigma-B regulation protein RsbU (phosphoserine phosphatase)
VGLLPGEPETRFAKPASDRTVTRQLKDLEFILQDIAAAAEYQQSLLPKDTNPLPGYEFGTVFRPARTVSGDFFDFIPLSQGRLGIAIADASGKGVAAALAAMTCRAMLRIQPEPDAAPARVLSNLNRFLYRNIKPGMFISGIYAVLDPQQHVLTVANAGHLPIVVWRCRAKVATIYPSKSPVLGVLPPPAYEAAAKDEPIALETGDRILLFTDGINEAMAPGQREFGMEHLRRRLRADSDGPTATFIANLTGQIDIHRSGAEQSDDITLITARRLP